MCIRIDLNSHIRCKQGICFEKRRNIRFHTKRIRIDPCKQMIHGRIGSNTHPVDLFLREMNASAHLMDHRVNGLFDHCILKFLLSARFLRFDDTVDNIRTKTNLTVTGRTLRQDLSCFHIDQNCRNCCSTDIYSKTTDHNIFFTVKNIVYIHIVWCCTNYTFHRKFTLTKYIRKFLKYCIWYSDTL